MDHGADRELALADPRVPGLGALLSGEAALDLLDALLPDGAERPRRVEVARGRYRRGSGFTATLTLHYADGPRHAFARAFAAGDTAGPAAALEHARRWTPPPDRPGAADLTALTGPRLRGPLHDPDLGVLVGPPADDQALPAVRRLVAEPQRFADPPPTRVRTLSYRAGRQWTGLLDGASGGPEAVVCARSDGVNAACYLAPAVAGIAVPDLLRVSRYGLLVARWLPGEPLDRLLLRDREAARGALAETGRLLARLHSVPPPPELPRRDPAALLSRAAEEVGDLLPGLASRAAAVARRCAEALAGADAAPAPVHGCLHPGRVVVGGRGPVLVGLEEAHAGHPAADLAHYAAACRAARPFQDGPAAVPEPLLDSYLAALPAPTARAVRRDLGGFTAAALLRRAAAPFRRGDPDWDAGVAALVAAAETALAEH